MGNSKFLWQILMVEIMKKVLQTIKLGGGAVCMYACMPCACIRSPHFAAILNVFKIREVY